MRFYADGLVERFSPVVFARCLLSVLGCGVLLVTLAPTPALAQISFVVFLLGPPLLGQVAEHSGAQLVRVSHSCC